jgi:hypothetical protein
MAKVLRTQNSIPAVERRLHRRRNPFPGGLPTFLDHLIWISVLETGISTKIVFDGLTKGGRPKTLRNLVVAFKMPYLRQRPIFLRIYELLAKAALRLGRLLPWPAHGYAVLVRSDRPTENAT